MTLISLNPNLMVQVFPQDAANPEWAVVRAGEIVMMFHRIDSLQSEYPILRGVNLGGSFTLYIQGRNITELFDKIKSQVIVIKDLQQTDYDTLEFSIQDLNGYILVFSETL
jgi:hypothetical protein